MPATLKCEYCGTPLPSGATHCEACGQVVRTPPVEEPTLMQPPPTLISKPPQELRPTPRPASTPPPAYKPAPAYTPPAAPPKRKSNLWIILGAVGCLGILCIAFVVLGVSIFLSSRSTTSEASKIIPIEVKEAGLPTERVIPTQVVLATKAPLPGEALPPNRMPTATQVPSLATITPYPTEAALSVPDDIPALAWPVDIGQMLTDSYFSDDFSNSDYDWAVAEDEINSWGVEDEHYALHLFEPDYSAWAYLPIDFTPKTIGFDAAVLPGYEQGAYGVICYYQDESNYHYISIDPSYQEYSIGYVVNDQYETLLEEMWMPSTGLKDSPYEVNNIMVVCDPDMITLFINNELEAQATISSVTEGYTAIFGETWEDTPSTGFKVLFDNFYAFTPVQ
jgi:hypothetical protein